MDAFPKIIPKTVEANTAALLQIARIRDADIIDRNNFPRIFLSARRVLKIPASSADVAATDREGDINWDASYLYLCVNNAGSAAWRRTALATW